MIGRLRPWCGLGSGVSNVWKDLVWRSVMVELPNLRACLSVMIMYNNNVGGGQKRV